MKQLHGSANNGKCLVHQDGWWTYKLCYGRYFKQFHVEDGREVDETLPDVIIMGRYDEKSQTDGYTDGASSASSRTPAGMLEPLESMEHHTELYADGTPCEVGKKTKRQTTIVYTCKEDSTYPRIISIVEPASCKYVVTVGMNDLCQVTTQQPLQCAKRSNHGPALAVHQKGAKDFSLNGLLINAGAADSIRSTSASTASSIEEQHLAELPRQCAIQIGKQFEGIDILGEEHPSFTVAECAVLCTNVQGCTVFLVDEGVCKLKRTALAKIKALPLVPDWGLFSNHFRMTPTDRPDAVGGVCHPNFPLDGVLANLLSWPEPRYVPNPGDEWRGEYTCKGLHQVQLHVIATSRHSSEKTGGRLVYVFKGFLVFGFTGTASQELPETSWDHVDGRYEPGSDNFDLFHSGDGTVQDLTYFSGSLGIDATTVAGVLPTCSDGPFKFQLIPPLKQTALRQGSSRNPPHSQAPPLECNKASCVRECDQSLNVKQPTIACLELLWQMAGCDLKAEYAPSKAPEKQRLHWLGQTPFDALDDMSWYAKYARQRKRHYPEWCLTPERLPKKGRFKTGSIRATYEDRLAAKIDLSSLAEQLLKLHNNREMIDSKKASVISQSAEMYRSILMPAQNQDKVRTAILRANVNKVYASAVEQQQDVLDRHSNAGAYIIQLENDAKVIAARLKLKYELNFSAKKEEKSRVFAKHAAIVQAIEAETEQKITALALDGEE